jgi:hypothetical protein
VHQVGFQYTDLSVFFVSENSLCCALLKTKCKVRTHVIFTAFCDKRSSVSVLQHAACRSHCYLFVRYVYCCLWNAYRNHHFHVWWAGRGVPHYWPPRSPDLKPPDFNLSLSMKELKHKLCCSFTFWMLVPLEMNISVN